MENLDAFKQFLVNKYDGTSTKTLLMSTGYISFPDMLKKTGLNKYIRISSGYRDPNRHVGKYWRTSNHGKLNLYGDSYAYDIVPIGISFEKMELLLRLHPEMNLYLIDNNFRLLNESTKEAMARTGATGKHFHLSYRPNSKEGEAWGIKTQTPTLQYLSLTIGVTPINTIIPQDLFIIGQQSTPIELPEATIKVLRTQRPLQLDSVKMSPELYTDFDPSLVPIIESLNIIIPKLSNPYLEQMLLALSYLNNYRDRIDLKILQGKDIYDLYLTLDEAEHKRKMDLEELKFMEALNNITPNNINALGGLLYDNVTNTINPNNKITSFSGKSIIPLVRY